ncbi:MAG: hypothetical protein ACE5DI_05440 [Candidatus Micrarchaeia archaeon]
MVGASLSHREEAHKHIAIKLNEHFMLPKTDAKKYAPVIHALLSGKNVARGAGETKVGELYKLRQAIKPDPKIANLTFGQLVEKGQLTKQRVDEVIRNVLHNLDVLRNDVLKPVRFKNYTAEDIRNMTQVKY